jgi:hypothetical protein
MLSALFVNPGCTADVYACLLSGEAPAVYWRRLAMTTFTRPADVTT